MTDREQQGQPRPDPKVAPETLEMRARPQPVTRINRKVVIGAAAVLLCLISFIVLLALKPPSLRIAGPQELFNVEHKPVTDALSKLPASYDGVKPEKKADAGKQPPTPPSPVPVLKAPTVDPLTDAERMEIARLARLAGQAKESGVFFRLQLKPAPKETKTTDVRIDPVPKAPPVETDGGLATLSALRAADRALALAGGDADLIGTSIGVADQTRKLTFLKSGPEKQVYNPHGLQTPVSAYQLMAGTVIAASLITGLNSDLPGFVIAQVTEHVYDTVTGRFLLIPQGSRLIGKYDNIVAFRPGARPRRLAAHHPARRLLHRHRQPARHRHRRLRRPRRRGRPPHLEAPEGRRARDRPRRRQRARLRLQRQRPRQGAAAVDAGHHQPRGTAPDRAPAQRAADHHGAPRLAAARDRPQGPGAPRPYRGTASK